MLQSSLPVGADNVHRFRHRKAGLGSLGKPRFAAMAKWQGGRVGREVKARTPAAGVFLRGTPNVDVENYPRILDSATRCRLRYERKYDRTCGPVSLFRTWPHPEPRVTGMGTTVGSMFDGVALARPFASGVPTDTSGTTETVGTALAGMSPTGLGFSMGLWVRIRVSPDGASKNADDGRQTVPEVREQEIPVPGKTNPAGGPVQERVGRNRNQVRMFGLRQCVEISGHRGSTVSIFPASIVTGVDVFSVHRPPVSEDTSRLNRPALYGMLSSRWCDWMAAAR